MMTAEHTARPLVLALAGPTASGKTALAMALAREFPLGLVSLDSAMVYRGMDIGTAKPTAAELSACPHALVDIREPSETYSVADFVRDADNAVCAALEAGRTPLLVGGTMLYLRAFRDGLAPLPPSDPDIRAGLEAEASRRGLVELHAELVAADPVAAEQIHPNNPQRLLRALEVLRQTGRPISSWWAAQAETTVMARLGVEFRAFAVQPASRAALHGAIEQRFDAMLAAGFLDEVRALRARGDLHPDLPSMRAVGYRQAWSYLDGAIDRVSMRDQGIAATRQLARRQLTWLRNWDWIVDGPSEEILDVLRQNLRASIGEHSGVAGSVPRLA